VSATRAKPHGGIGESARRVDGTPKVEKEKTTLRSFVKARSWTGLFGDAYRFARAWR